MVFDLWQRPTIKWDLECEWSGTGREQAIQMFDVNIVEDKPLVGATIGTSTTGLGLIGFFGFAGFCFFGIPIVFCAASDEPQVAVVE